jgi:hypothetical protein
MSVPPLRASLLALAALSAGCVDNYSTYFPNGYDPVLYVVGDTVKFVAQEQMENMNDHQVFPASDSSPGSYSWTSSQSDVATVVSPGTIAMKSVGQSRLTVRGRRSSFSITLSAIPASASVHVEPRDIQAKVGDTVSMSIGLLDAGGALVPSVPLRTVEVSILLRDNYDPTVLPIDPVLVPVLNQFRFVVRKPGRVTAVAQTRVFKRSTLKDSIVVTVK